MAWYYILFRVITFFFQSKDSVIYWDNVEYNTVIIGTLNLFLDPHLENVYTSHQMKEVCLKENLLVTQHE